jgi:hypothetical protein
LVDDVLSKLPLIGNLVDFGESALGRLTKASTGASLGADPNKGFIDQLKDELNGFGLKAANEVQEFLQRLFFKLLGEGDAGFSGLNILVLTDINGDSKIDYKDVDIKVTADLNSSGDSSIEAHLKLGKRGDMLVGKDVDLGFNGLGLVGFQLDGGIDIELGYTIDLGFKIDKQNGFTLLLNNTAAPEMQFSASVSLQNNTTFDAQLFFLKLRGTDGNFDSDPQTTGISGTFTLDLTAPGNKAPISDIGLIGFKPSFNLVADIEMQLSTGFRLGTADRTRTSRTWTRRCWSTGTLSARTRRRRAARRTCSLMTSRWTSGSSLGRCSGS